MNPSDNPNPSPQEILLGMVVGAWTAQAVGSLARLRIADAVGPEGATAAEVAARLGLDPDATFRLMRAVTVAGVFTRAEGGRFLLTPLGECLRSDVPGSMRSFLDAETNTGHWVPWGRLDARVRQGELQTEATLGADLWTYYQQHPEEERTFAEAMGNLSAGMAGPVLAAYDFGDPRRVVDVGGSQGVLLGGVLNRYPQATGVLFDLPHIVAGAEESLGRLGVADRVEKRGGSFLEAVPEGGDVYLLKHILHDWDDASCVTILRNVRAAMTPGARVLVVEMLVGGEDPGPAALLDLNMMVLMPGRERTAEEFAALFAAAGLELKRVVPTGSPMFVLEAAAV